MKSSTWTNYICGFEMMFTYSSAMRYCSVISNADKSRDQELAELRQKYTTLEKKLDHLALAASIARGDVTKPTVQLAPEAMNIPIFQRKSERSSM